MLILSCFSHDLSTILEIFQLVHHQLIHLLCKVEAETLKLRLQVSLSFAYLSLHVELTEFIDATTLFTTSGLFGFGEFDGHHVQELQLIHIGLQLLYVVVHV